MSTKVGVSGCSCSSGSMYHSSLIFSHFLLFFSVNTCFIELTVKAYLYVIFWDKTHTHPFNGPFSGTTWVSRYQKGKTNLDFTEARDSEWYWHQMGHLQVCISLQTDNHASTPPLKFFYRPDALPAAQPTASKHWRHWDKTPKPNCSFII